MAKSVNELAEITARVHLRALKAAEKALLEPGDPDYDGSGDVPWKERSTRVAAGLALAAKAMDHVRETDVGVRQFGLLLMKERFKSVSDWERHAAEVDAAPSPTKTTTIDAEVVHAQLPAKEET
jgi:hypothetical protein